jgi:NAD(P)-dependent dehydrogenase (short-subunit alcohol dehydrogenase family)
MDLVASGAHRQTAAMLDAKICLVTGAGGGIGSVTATLMAERGAAAVILTDISADRCEWAAEGAAAAGAETLVRACDLTDAGAVESLMAEVSKRFGRLDVLHNNAGLLDTQLTDQTRIDTIPEAAWDGVFAVNVRGAWLCTKHAAPLLRVSGHSAIVNCSSVSGFLAFPDEPAYCASKAAVIQLTRSTALDFARDGIRCNCYCPQSVRTPMLDAYFDGPGESAQLERDLASSHLIPRLGRPEEIARLVCFLASDEASFINGAAYLIDGGSLAWRGLLDSAVT